MASSNATGVANFGECADVLLEPYGQVIDENGEEATDSPLSQ
jgi:hypothetical protein